MRSPCACDCRPQVAAALEYIDQHKQEVLAGYERILDRERRGNPPEVQVKLDAIHEEFQTLVAQRRAKEGAHRHDQANGR